MTYNIYKNKAIKEKWIQEGLELAEVRMRASAKDKEYYGDDTVAKYQRHNGEYVYVIKESVVKEFLEYTSIIHEALETVYWWENQGTPKNVSRKEKRATEFISEVKPDEKILKSLFSCYKGSPMMSFARDEAAVELRAKEDEERNKVIEHWSL